MDKVFSLKRTYTGDDGDEYIDMSIPVINISNIKGNATERLSPDDNGRIDNFVWKYVKKDMDSIDTLMYANHIFNPFAVKEGEIIYVPLEAESLYTSSGEPSLPDGSKYSKNVKGESEMTYAEKVAYLAGKGLGVK